MRARVTRWSVDAYEQLGELGVIGKEVELIRGIIVQEISKSPMHFTLTESTSDRFRSQLPAGYVVHQEGPLRLADSRPEPDVAVVHGTKKDFSTRHPTIAELVVEVAVSSAALDRENAALYAEAGVPEYWIVLGGEQQIEVYRCPENGAYQQKRLYTVGETLACESVPGLSAPLEDWFA